MPVDDRLAIDELGARRLDVGSERRVGVSPAAPEQTGGAKRLRRVTQPGDRQLFFEEVPRDSLEAGRCPPSI